MNWHLQDAKNNFSKVVQKARTEGPQTVTLRGERAAVVISAEEYDRLRSGQQNFIDHLLAFPELDEEIIDEINRRPVYPPRPVDL